MAVLDIHEVSIRFGGLQALGDVSVSVHEWEIVGLIGPNGAGKTTLFNCVTGFYRPDRGRVRFLGDDLTEVPIHERAALGMGRTFQQVGLVKGATVLENLITAQHPKIEYSAAAGALGVPATLRQERLLRERALEILDLVGLVELADSRVAGLPYGTMKNVEMAAVLATDPEVLMLDEPSSGMGPEEAHQLGDTLLRLRKELGLTILMIEHHVPLVVRVCDYVYCLNFGQLLTEGLPDEVRNHPEVVTAYLGEEVEDEVDESVYARHEPEIDDREEPSRETSEEPTREVEAQPLDEEGELPRRPRTRQLQEERAESVKASEPPGSGGAGEGRRRRQLRARRDR